LLLYLNIAGSRWGPGKMLLEAWKVLGKSWNFFDQESGKTVSRNLF